MAPPHFAQVQAVITGGGEQRGRESFSMSPFLFLYISQYVTRIEHQAPHRMQGSLLS